jgi:hypothetical protein
MAVLCHTGRAALLFPHSQEFGGYGITDREMHLAQGRQPASFSQTPKGKTMSSNSIQHRIIAALVASLAVTAGVASSSQAAQNDDYVAHSTQSCKDAKLAAWFERQRQLTDGDTNPAQSVALPTVCRDAGRMAEAASQQVVAGNVQADNQKLR